jgi:hypothetical protein
MVVDIKGAQHALDRLTANVYTRDDIGREQHRLDVVTLRVMIRDIPGGARRWKWLRMRISKETLEEIIKTRFKAPHRSYAADIDDTLDRTIARDST